MSSQPPPHLHVGIVCEGPIDFIVISSALQSILPPPDCDTFNATLIQPERSNLGGGHSGRFGGGWRGVQSWCQTHRVLGDSSWRSSIPGRFDLFIVQIDADAASESDIDCAQPCPPAWDTVRELRRHVLGWLDEPRPPNNIEPRPPKNMVLCIPAQNTDAWVLSALFTHDPHVGPGLECLLKPEQQLTRHRDSRGKRLVKPNRSKSSAPYDANRAQIAQNWGRAVEFCAEARRFTLDIWRALYPTLLPGL